MSTAAPPGLDIPDLARTLLGKDEREIDAEERRVLQNIVDRTPVSRDAGNLAAERSSFGERLADRVAAVGGSWSFIIAFAIVLFGWMVLNTDILARWNMAFDPYPYIFLNLMLSTLAAVQAPVILMSQNRQASKDRIAASLDYEVNLRAELEILALHGKIDRDIAARLAGIEATLEEIVAAGPH